MPADIIYFIASSRGKSSSITSDLGIIMEKPDVGFGVVGMNTLAMFSPCGVSVKLVINARE